jgi:large subunit ribosomal protein L6
MSRVGRKPVVIPDKVKVNVSGRTIQVEGPLGKLDAVIPEGMAIAIEGGQAEVGPAPVARGTRGYQGLVRALLANMVEGVSKGYEKKLEINGVGYKAELNGGTLTMSVGYSHPIEYKLPKGIDAEVDKQTVVTVKGIDKQLVGQVAAQLRAFKVCEPYKAKGIKYSDETIRRKVGKTGAK